MIDVYKNTVLQDVQIMLEKNLNDWTSHNDISLEMSRNLNSIERRLDGDELGSCTALQLSRRK